LDVEVDVAVGMAAPILHWPAAAAVVIDVQSHSVCRSFIDAARLFRVHLGCRGGATECSGNGSQRGADHCASGAARDDTYRGARGYTGHYAAARHHRLDLVPQRCGILWKLRRGIRILRRNSVPWAGLFGQILVDGFGAGPCSGGFVHDEWPE
jgi:hypothetical protein